MKQVPNRSVDVSAQPRRGRPRGSVSASEPGSTISVWVPVSAHDRLIERARQEDVSVSSLVRQLLILRLS